MTSADSRLASFKSLLAHTREQLGLDVGFVLWDGSTVPSDLAPNALAISLADEGVVAALLRRPKGDTLGNLWVSGRVDLRNGTILDLGRIRPRPDDQGQRLRSGLNRRGLGVEGSLH